MSDHVKGRKWRRLDGLKEWLAFSRKETVGDPFTNDQAPPELRSGYSVSGEQVEFADGTALVIVSGVVFGSDCPTCGDNDEGVCFYYALETP